MSWKSMNCANCFYAVDVYGEKGEKTGVECRKRNSVFIDADDAMIESCYDYAVRDD